MCCWYIYKIHFHSLLYLQPDKILVGLLIFFLQYFCRSGKQENQTDSTEPTTWMQKKNSSAHITCLWYMLRPEKTHAPRAFSGIRLPTIQAQRLAMLEVIASLSSVYLPSLAFPKVFLQLSIILLHKASCVSFSIPQNEDRVRGSHSSA